MSEQAENNLSSGVGLDITAFKTGATQLAQQIRGIETSFRASAATMGDWANTSNGLTQRTDSLSQKLDLQRQKLSLLQKAYDAVRSSEGDHEKELASLANQMYSVEKSITGTEKDLKNYNDQLKDLNNNAKKVNLSSLKDGLSKVGSGVATGLKTAGAAIAGMGAAAVGAATGAFKLAEQASDLVEAQNVVENTFKKSSKSIEAWTNTTAASAGISKTASTQWVGFMGAMLKSSGVSESSSASMSENLVQLTGDMSSFYNISTSDMWEKIRAGMSGETKPLKDLGINMDVANLSAFALAEGIKKPYASMSQAEQTQLRYNYLMKTTADAQGDFARTSGTSLANQIRIFQMGIQGLATSAGAMLLPMVNNTIKSVNGLITTLNTAITTGKGFGQLGTAVGTALSGILSKVTAALPGATQMAVTVIKQLLASVIAVLPSMLPTLVKGVTQLLNAAITVLQSSGPMLIQAATTAVITLANGLIQALPQIISAATKMLLTLVGTLSDQLPSLIPVAINAVLTIAEELVRNIPQIVQAAIKLILGFVEGITAALPTLVAEAPNIIMELIKGLVAALPELINAAPKIIIAIIEGIVNELPTLVNEVPTIMEAIIIGLINALPQLLAMGPKIIIEVWNGLKTQNWGNLGKNILEGIAQGFSDAWDDTKDAISGVGSKILGQFKNIFGIHSPSTVMREQIGKNISLGIVNGINDVNFVQAITDTINQNSGNLDAAAKKVATMVTDRIGTIKDATAKVVADLNKQYAQLAQAEKTAESGTKGTVRTAIEQEYDKKKQAIKDEITLRKQQATQEIEQINKVKTAATDAISSEEDARKTFVSNVNNLADQLKNALKAKYQEDEQNQEDALNQGLDNLENWKTQSEDAINDVYSQKEQAVEDSANAATAAIQAEIDALDAQTQAEDRAAKRKQYTDKIADLQGQIAYSHDDYNKAQLQKQLAQETADYQSELDSEATEDKKASLQAQINDIKNAADAQKQELEQEKTAALANIDAIYTAKKNSLNQQLSDLKAYYANAESDASLEAQAEQLIVSKNQDAIVKLLNSYGDQYQQAGQTLGDRLSSGFSTAINSISAMISSVTAQIAAARDSAISVMQTASAQTGSGKAASGTAAKAGTAAGGTTVVKSYNVTVQSAVKQTVAEATQQANLGLQKIIFQTT